MNNNPMSLATMSLNPKEVVIDRITAIRCNAINIEMILVRKPTKINAPKIISMIPKTNIKLVSEKIFIKNCGTNGSHSCG